MRSTASTCAVRRSSTPTSAPAPAARAQVLALSASLRALLVAGLASAGIAGCTASAEDVRAPQDQLFFPTGLAVSADEKTLFVANANSELRYDSGSISVVDLGVVETVLADWLDCQKRRLMTPGIECSVPADCSQDPDHGETMVCHEASAAAGAPQFLKRDAGVRIGNFATDLAIQAFSPDRSRVFVPTRGDPSIAWADFDAGSLHCSDDSGYAQCDDLHRLTLVLDDPDLGIPTEPYAVCADARNGFAMVTHLNSGAVTLINAPADSSQVGIVDLVVNVFAPNALGIRGASAIAERPPSAPGDADLVYVGSSTENRIQTFAVGRRNNAAEFLLPGAYFFLHAVGNNAGDSNDTRSVRFSPTGTRMYVANRVPPSLQVYDTTLGPTGVPRNTPSGSSDICREASTLAVVDLGPVVGERAFVTCFQDGQVYVVDPAGQTRVEDIITVGRGPYAAAGARTSQRLFVSNFLEDTIAVIDISPTSPMRNRVVLRIGTPRAP